jgi:DNA-binding HxlR family transcriptional regulator
LRLKRECEKVKYLLDELKKPCYGARMRSYRQFCALAKALDVVGDRWSLLIVRELLIRGPSRYTDIRRGLPGVATNLLADRLRELDEAGVVRKVAASPPIATALFELTPRGKQLRDVVLALGGWGAPLLLDAPDDDAFQTHWLELPLEVRLADHAPDAPAATIEVRTGEEPLVIEVADGEVRTHPGSAERPDAILAGPHRMVLGVLAGRLDLGTARRGGVHFEGDPSVLGRVQPRAVEARG